MAVKGRKWTTLLVATFVAIADADTDVPNWVSPINVTDSACYRKTYLSSETCAIGYESDGIASCWAQCPLNFPVECGAECIPQSSDCTSEVLDKVTSVATVALNAATAGVFGEFIKASKALQLGVKCGQSHFAATSSLVSYVDELQANATQSEQLLSVVNQSDLVINELPAAVCTCLGLPVSTDTLELSADVVAAVNQIVTEVVENGASLLDPRGKIELLVKINGDGGDDSDESGSAEQNDSEAESGDDDSATPAPTTSEDEDQIQQTPIAEEDDGRSESDDGAATPAPTSADDGNVTPAPTTVDADQTTKQSHKTASIRFHLTSKGSTKVNMRVHS
ncbi:hypothetical protein KRP22_009066 [Phytophthora ramorum]|nr:hypothetical protein KRP22_7897 [Phytophthora ramorum]